MHTPTTTERARMLCSWDAGVGPRYSQALGPDARSLQVRGRPIPSCTLLEGTAPSHTSASAIPKKAVLEAVGELNLSKTIVNVWRPRRMMGRATTSAGRSDDGVALMVKPLEESSSLGLRKVRVGSGGVTSHP